MWLNAVNSILLSPLNVYLGVSHPTAESAHYVRGFGFSLLRWPGEESTLRVTKQAPFPETSSGRPLSVVGWQLGNRWWWWHIELWEMKFIPKVVVVWSVLNFKWSIRDASGGRKYKLLLVCYWKYAFKEFRSWSSSEAFRDLGEDAQKCSRLKPSSGSSSSKFRKIWMQPVFSKWGGL